MTGTLVTGSGPHAGDERADRLDLALDDVVRIHGAAMILFLGVTLAVLWMAHDGDADTRVVDRLRQLLVVLVAQAGIGYWQYFTDVPAVLVGFHVFGAALVWIAVLRVWFSLSEPAAASMSAVPAAAMARSGTADGGVDRAVDTLRTGARD
jgi:cytochrome c oxidase assembly protein subunit 15